MTVRGGKVASEAALPAVAEPGVMRAAGHTSALLWTFRENRHNRALYAKHGWTPDGTEQETLPGVVEVRYRREL